MEVHWHLGVPVVHSCPLAQAFPPLLAQTQTPEAQALVLMEAVQSTHWMPPVPQVVVPEVLQVLPLQQPVEHELASQMHWPPEQRCPEPQCWPLPVHPQVPEKQVSPLVAEQSTHAAPLAPQALLPEVWQAPPLQQPVQELESQTHAPAWQWRPSAQCTPAPVQPQLPERQVSPLPQCVPPAPQPQVPE